MNNEKEVQRFYLRNNPINGLTYMASGQPPILGGTLYVLAADYDTLRRQLAEAEKSRDYARQLAADASIKFAETAAKLALAEQALREWLTDGIVKDYGSVDLRNRTSAAIAAGEGSRD